MICVIGNSPFSPCTDLSHCCIRSVLPRALKFRMACSRSLACRLFVVFAAFVPLFLLGGSVYSSGVVFNELLKRPCENVSRIHRPTWTNSSAAPPTSDATTIGCEEATCIECEGRSMGNASERTPSSEDATDCGGFGESRGSTGLDRAPCACAVLFFSSLIYSLGYVDLFSSRHQSLLRRRRSNRSFRLPFRRRRRFRVVGAGISDRFVHAVSRHLRPLLRHIRRRRIRLSLHELHRRRVATLAKASGYCERDRHERRRFGHRRLWTALQCRHRRTRRLAPIFSFFDVLFHWHGGFEFVLRERRRRRRRATASTEAVQLDALEKTVVRYLHCGDRCHLLWRICAHRSHSKKYLYIYMGPLVLYTISPPCRFAMRAISASARQTPTFSSPISALAR